MPDIILRASGMTAKLPAFQFYVGDWKKDPAIQCLSLEEKGACIEILCIMHESEERGKLLLNNKALPEIALARALGIPQKKLSELVSTLIDYGVFYKDEVTGALCSKRMIRDEALRQTRVEGGYKGAAHGRSGGRPEKIKKSSKVSPQALGDRVLNLPEKTPSTYEKKPLEGEEENPLGGSKKTPSPVAEKPLEGGQKNPPSSSSSISSSDNNILSSSEIEAVRENRYGEDSLESKLSSLLYVEIQKKNPKHKPPNLQVWAKHVDLMLRVDKRSAKEIAEMIHWVQQDSFWQSNILSTQKLREKFDQLTLRKKSEEEKNASNSRNFNSNTAKPGKYSWVGNEAKSESL